MDAPGHSTILTFPQWRVRPPGKPAKQVMTKDFNIRLMLIPEMLEKYLRSKSLERVPPQLRITMEQRKLLTYRPL